jgi:YD repeat-containing protein
MQWVISESDPGGRLEVDYDPTGRTLVITPPHSEWWGSEVITLVAIAPDGISGNAEAAFAVTSVNDPPELLLPDSYRKLKGTAFDTLDLDTCVSDTDDASGQLTWTFQSGKIFKVRNLDIKRKHDGTGDFLIRRDLPRVVIEPKTSGGAPVIDEDTWVGTDTLTFSVSDPGGKETSKEVLFTKYELYIPPLQY